MTYPLSIITPEGQVYEGQVQALTAVGYDGGFGVLANHAPMIVKILPGVVKVTADKDLFFSVGAGVLEVNASHHVLLLVDAAFPGATEEEAKSKIKELIVT
ncbi:MAG: hypothetical protein A2Z88_04355 [Omnitrophica WOR_2 bacterium GWA2_47_8]|nr:MAG: hypothetical protein A2Z88_04355 [Omnitrophica WOR_2 bacterium GWA2_47_8]